MRDDCIREMLFGLIYSKDTRFDIGQDFIKDCPGPLNQVFRRSTFTDLRLSNQAGLMPNLTALKTILLIKGSSPDINLESIQPQMAGGKPPGMLIKQSQADSSTLMVRIDIKLVNKIS